MTGESCGIGAMNVLAAEEAMTAPASDEISDWLGLRQTRKERQEEALREALANEHLSVEGAAWLLAGVCPDRSPGPAKRPDEQPGGWFVFPGSQYPEHELSALRSFDKEMERRIGFVRGRLAHLVRGGTDAVLETRVLFALSIQHNLTPPWWAWASADPICSPLLPGAAEASQRPSEAPGSAASEGVGQTIQSKGGKAAARNRYPNRDEHMAFAESLFRKNPNITGDELLKALGSKFADLEDAFGKEKRRPGFLKKLTAMRRERKKAKAKANATR